MSPPLFLSSLPPIQFVSLPLSIFVYLYLDPPALSLLSCLHSRDDRKTSFPLSLYPARALDGYLTIGYVISTQDESLRFPESRGKESVVIVIAISGI